MAKKSEKEILADDSYLIAQSRKVDISAQSRVAVFLNNWVEATERGGLVTKTLKAWRRGSMIFCNEDIDRIVSLGAPVKVFVEENANRCSKR